LVIRLPRTVEHDALDSLLRANKIRTAAPNQTVDWGFRYANLDHLLALTDAGRDAERHIGKVRGVNVQLIASEANDRADPLATERVAKRTGAALYLFPRSLGLPHDCSAYPETVARIREITLARIARP
jgi:hypothetical protein